MRAKIVLVTGGARSGKSRYAEERAVAAGARLLYVATAEVKDEEMAERVAEHRRRRDDRWITVEEPVDLGGALLRHQSKVDCAVVDCLTLWVSNLLERDEQSVVTRVEELARLLPDIGCDIFFVTNEVGSGIVPDNPLARKFRDLAGWTNQRIASVADEVILMVSGVPMAVKRGKSAFTRDD